MDPTPPMDLCVVDNNNEILSAGGGYDRLYTFVSSCLLHWRHERKGRGRGRGKQGRSQLGNPCKLAAPAGVGQILAPKFELRLCRLHSNGSFLSILAEQGTLWAPSVKLQGSRTEGIRLCTLYCFKKSTSGNVSY